jgi:hypothetical protein
VRRWRVGHRHRGRAAVDRADGHRRRAAVHVDELYDVDHVDHEHRVKRRVVIRCVQLGRQLGHVIAVVGRRRERWWRRRYRFERYRRLVRGHRRLGPDRRWCRAERWRFGLRRRRRLGLWRRFRLG